MIRFHGILNIWQYLEKNVRITLKILGILKCCNIKILYITEAKDKELDVIKHSIFTIKQLSLTILK